MVSKMADSSRDKFDALARLLIGGDVGRSAVACDLVARGRLDRRPRTPARLAWTTCRGEGTETCIWANCENLVLPGLSICVITRTIAPDYALGPDNRRTRPGPGRVGPLSCDAEILQAQALENASRFVGRPSVTGCRTESHSPVAGTSRDRHATTPAFQLLRTLVDLPGQPSRHDGGRGPLRRAAGASCSHRPLRVSLRAAR